MPVTWSCDLYYSAHLQTQVKITSGPSVSLCMVYMLQETLNPNTGSVWSWSRSPILCAAIIFGNIWPLMSQSSSKAIHCFKTNKNVINGTSHSRFWVLRVAWGISCSARGPESCSLECGDRRDGGGNEAFNPVCEKRWTWVAQQFYISEWQ